jgi:hypothetical protein
MQALLSAWGGGEPSFILKAKAMAFGAKHFTSQERAEAKQFADAKDWEGLRSYCESWLSAKEQQSTKVAP